MSLPETVQALVYTQHGGPEVIDKVALPFPQHKPNEILVKIVYGGINTIDTYFRKGIYPVEKFPWIAGVEAGGIVLALPTDESVLNNKWYKERSYKVGGRIAVQTRGAFTEYVSVEWTKTYSIPDAIPLDIGAGSLSHALTAVTFMNEAYDVKKGDIIFIHTVAGGLGLLFTAYAKSRGATVIGTTSTEEKATLAKSYGADHVILYTKENFVERVNQITNGEGVHAVFDGVGKDTFLADFDILRRKGTLVAVGNASGPPDPISPLKLSAKNLKLLRPTLFNYIATPEETNRYVSEVWDAIQSGLFKIRIVSTHPFTAQGLRDAQAEITTPGGKLAGKILLKISEE